MGKHYVPQKYLQGFAVPGDATTIWMYDKKKGIWSRPAIKQVAQQRDYFPEDVEKQLATQVEGPGNLVLDRLRDGATLSSKDRETLANYIAVMIMRVPRKRRKGLEMVPRLRESTMARVREEIAGSAEKVKPEMIFALLQEVDRLAEQYEKETPAEIVEQIDSPWPTKNILGAVGQMTWRIAQAPPETFILTSDNPSFFFDAYGVGSQNAELTFPISTRLALLGSYQGVPGGTLTVRIRRAVAKEVNRRLISGAERFVFSPYRADWVAVIASKPKLYLSRIQW